MTGEDEYETPVDFGDAAQQSSGMASIDTPASAPVFSSGDVIINNNAAIHSEPRPFNTTADGNSFHSSPQFRYNNNNNSSRSSSSTPQRTRMPRDLEQKLRYRHNYRDRLESRNIPRTNHSSIANNNTNATATANYTDTEDNQLPAATAAPLPKALTDLLLQTAILGIDTTAKLSKPTLALTRNTLLPQIILPLLTELWETYAPDRLQTWAKVIPSSLSNLYDLLWDTDAGRQFGNSSLQLGEDVLDMMTSEVARQLWIDVTVALVKVLDALHTPEVRALLDQYAVSMCRLVDVMSSGKAKQVWFDLSDTIWAALEVGNDDVMVMALAEGCAKVCFALERERDSLKRRRRRGVSNGDGEVGKSGKVKTEALIDAARRRKERDQRQMETYPPGKEVLRGEENGRSDIEDALLDGLGCLARNEEQPPLETDDADQIYMNMGSVDDNDNERPPEKVIVPTSSMDESPRPNVDVLVRDDDESEITTEIEDLRRNESDLPTQSKQMRYSQQEQQREGALFYEEEHDDNNIGPVVNDDDINHEEDETSEQYDNFDESVLQFYRRLNDVLTQTRKEAKLREALEAKDESPEENECTDSRENHLSSQLIKEEESDGSQPAMPSYFGIGQFMISKKWWKLLLVAWICGTLTMCLLWAALGCYGFYIIFIAETHLPSLPPSQAMQPPIVIQITTATSQGLKNECNSVETQQADIGEVASISLDQWKELQRDVDVAIDQAKQSS